MKKIFFFLIQIQSQTLISEQKYLSPIKKERIRAYFQGEILY